MRNPQRFFHQRGAGHRATDQTDAIRRYAVDEVCGQQVVLCLRETAEERPDDVRMVARGNAKPDVSVGDLRLFRHQADVCHERDSQARADRDAIDGRDDDLGAAGHAVHDIAGLAESGLHTRVIPDHGFDPGKITAGGKRFALASDDHDPGIGVIVHVHPDPR